MQVVSKRTWRGDGYYIGRPSALGNPFVIGRDGDRNTVIEKYRRWLYGKITAGDADVLLALAQANEHEHLICWCAPEPCHGDVLVRAIAWARGEGWLRSA